MKYMDTLNIKIDSLQIVDLINNTNVSVRLKNSINQAADHQKLPFITVGDFLAAEDGVYSLMRTVPSLGKKTADEFVQLIHDIAKSQAIDFKLSDLSSPHKQELIAKSNDFFELSKEGFSYQEIAELHDVSEGTVRRYLKEHPDFDTRSAPAALQRQQKRLEKSSEFLDLYKQGMTYQEIGDKHGLTRERVRQLLNLAPAFSEYLEEYEAAKVLAEQEKEEKAKRKSHGSSFSFLYPEQTAKLWDYVKNGELNPEQVSVGNTLIDVWLKCPVDGYSWKKKPAQITRHSWQKGTSGCPVCAGKSKKPEKQPSLLEAYSELVSQYWDYEKNEILGLNPETITLASNRKVWFKCSHDDCQWEARVMSTVNQQWSKGNTGCRVCNGTNTRKPSVWTRREPLTTEFPDEVEKYWDYEKNNPKKLYPNKVTAGSSKKAWFKCQIDGYEWFSSIAPTVQSWKEGISGCSRCGKGWTTEAIRQFVASLEKYIPNLTQAERYKIFEQAGVLNAKSPENIKLIRDIIRGKLSGQKLKEFIQGKDADSRLKPKLTHPKK